MSAEFLVVIPVSTQSCFPDTAEAIRQALMEFAGTKEAKAKDYGKVQFIDAGTNFENVTCPDCNTTLAMSLWQDWMDEDWHGEDGFHLHKHKMPCCGTSLSLNDLEYHQPQGFAQWFVSARNPGRGPLTKDELAQLGAIAGMPLESIAQRY